MPRCAPSSTRRPNSPPTTRSRIRPSFTPTSTSSREAGPPMPIQVLMPALSPTMEKGNLAKWHKKEGDAVKSGDVIAEIETDKATMEVEAVDEGTMGKIVVPEGTQAVKVNAVIALLLEEGEDAKALAGAGMPAAKPAPASQAAAPPQPAAV